MIDADFEADTPAFFFSMRAFRWSISVSRTSNCCTTLRALDPPKTSQFFTYQNGTQKEVLSDGTTTVYFTNGDRKRTYANEKKGIVVYYYAATQVSSANMMTGVFAAMYHFQQSCCCIVIDHSSNPPRWKTDVPLSQQAN
jgi:hypothetical protein